MGSCIPHSDQPNVRLMPFLYAPNNQLDEKAISFTLLWPTESLEAGDYLTRDYLNGIKEEKQRSYRMAAWQRLPSAKLLSLINDYDMQMLKLCADSVTLM